MSGRTIVVGDVHGCSDELDDLLQTCNFGDGDALVSVGDVVAKGPDSRGVIERLQSLGARAVRGNHDQHCLKWWNAKQAGEPLPVLKPHHQQVCATIDEAHWRWLAALPLSLELPEYETIVVHAGMMPGVGLSDQEPYDLMNMRSIDADGRPSKYYEDGAPWASVWGGPQLIVFGHDAIRGLQEYPYAIGLDTGCVYGGSLSALLLPERRIVSVRARREWVPIL